MERAAQTDLLVIGGGINGAGIARDAAGRGFGVVLCERGDLGGATSSASSKLIHGGLRYLEQYEFRLVREALAEREVLLHAAPHLVRPLRFVMPHVPGLRPAWVLRAGLLFYDYLARRQTLPRSRHVDLGAGSYGDGLRPGLSSGFVYSDCQVDDSRLVIANARAAAGAGATILPRTACVAAHREGGVWSAQLQASDGTRSTLRARALINAAGPWAARVFTEILKRPAPHRLKLVQGSHIVVPRLYAGSHAFILQNDDGRVVFVCPYEEEYSLVGTTESEVPGGAGACTVREDEVVYLCQAANRYFSRQLAPCDVVWCYCGLRPLFDDGAANPSAITRDYVLHVDGSAQEPPLLSVFGGKITTYRRLAEQALDSLAGWFPQARSAWTAGAHLPGGDLAGVDAGQFAGFHLQRDYPWLEATVRTALARRHGSDAAVVLEGAATMRDLGRYFGGGLYAREVDYFVDREWARTAEDVLWRRTKAGLRLTAGEQQALGAYIEQRVS